MQSDTRIRDPHSALVAARELLGTPERSTRSHTARNKNGYPTSPLSSAAVSFDASGALVRVTGRRRDCPGFDVLVTAAGGFRAFAELTTRGTHAEVLAIYDRAIAATLRGARVRIGVPMDGPTIAGQRRFGSFPRGVRSTASARRRYCGEVRRCIGGWLVRSGRRAMLTEAPRRCAR